MKPTWYHAKSKNQQVFAGFGCDIIENVLSKSEWRESVNVIWKTNEATSCHLKDVIRESSLCYITCEFRDQKQKIERYT